MLLQKYKCNHGAQKIQLGYVLDNVFFFENTKRLIITGLLPGELVLTRGDLEPLRGCGRVLCLYARICS